MATNGNTVHQEQYGSSAAPAEATSASSTSNNPSKDEVGWYFVEQYYTTLSKNPAKLHLFYNKSSQFVQGLEAELVNVAVGRQAIQERIKELDFQDCKVRVSNVDSQASYNNIVIQVIGEISNKSGEPKKFVQTFVLAQQPAGYFLLNDILRYVNEGEEEATEGAVSETAPVAEPEVAQEPAAEPVPEKVDVVEATSASPELDAQAVDKKLEEATAADKETPSAPAVDTPVEVAAAAEEAPSNTEAAEAAEPVSNPEKIAEEVVEEETSKPELPKDPSPTPAPPSRAAAPEPEKPKGPPKPMTWASRIAAAAGPVKPVVPVIPKAAAAPTAQSKPTAPAQSNAPAQPAEAPAQTVNKEAASEWRTAGADSKRQSRQQPTAAAPTGKDDALAYVKFVTDKVKDEDLRGALGGFGELVYFDINRSKNCAFVEYASPAGYQAAVGASPIVVNGENIVIEPRRPKAGAYGGANYNQTRGGISGRGRLDGQRSGSQGGGRGGYASRGRGGASRGRGGPQAANA